MEIKCTPKELKELLQKETPVAGTTDVVFNFDMKKFLSQHLANYDKPPKDE